MGSKGFRDRQGFHLDSPLTSRVILDKGYTPCTLVWSPVNRNDKCTQLIQL